MSDQKEWPIEDWQDEVANGDTLLGYHEWVEHRKEAAERAAVESERLHYRDDH